MNLFSTIVIMGIVLFVGFVLWERFEQRHPVSEREYDMSLNEDFAEIEENLYDNKTDEEFQLGLALAAVLDSLDNSEEYTEEMLNGLYLHAEDQVVYWRLKYNKEILALSDQYEDL